MLALRIVQEMSISNTNFWNGFFKRAEDEDAKLYSGMFFREEKLKPSFLNWMEAAGGFTDPEVASQGPPTMFGDNNMGHDVYTGYQA